MDKSKIRLDAVGGNVVYSPFTFSTRGSVCFWCQHYRRVLSIDFFHHHLNLCTTVVFFFGSFVCAHSPRIRVNICFLPTLSRENTHEGTVPVGGRSIVTK